MSIEVERSPHLLCHRCEGPLVLAARISTGWINASGAAVSGTRMVPLCDHCDHDRPASLGLLAFCRQNASLTDENLDEFAALLSGWLVEIGPANIDDADLADALTAWRAESELR